MEDGGEGRGKRRRSERDFWWRRGALRCGSAVEGREGRWIQYSAEDLARWKVYTVAEVRRGWWAPRVGRERGFAPNLTLSDHNL